MISEIFGNLRELKSLGAKETYLVLVKIRFSGMANQVENINSAAASYELITGLESDLSNITIPYLTVRLTYKHSAFLDLMITSSGTEASMSGVTTRLQSEATATIQRTNLQSQWSPRTSRTMHGSADVNPLIKLIETHFRTDKARSALHKLANERVPIPPARRLDNASDAVSSSEETSQLRPGTPARLDPTATVPSYLSSANMDGATDPAAEGAQSEAEPGRDPARQIWTEIRRTSRGGVPRSSACNATPTDDPDSSPGLISTGAAVDEERNRIMETAVKNRRSLGAESLRSIAPSLMSTETKAEGSSRRWRWGGLWW